MKKWISLLSLGIMTMTTAHAQHIKIGPEAGLNLTNISTKMDGYDDEDNQPRLGLKIGGIIDIGFNRMVSLQPGLYFSQKGYRLQYSDVYTSGGATYRETEKYNTRINYLELPVNLQLKFGMPGSGQFFVGAGPYVALALGGHVHYEHNTSLQSGSGGIYDSEDDDYDLEIGNSADDDDVKSSDAGINANLGFMTRHGFFVRGNMGVGLVNIIPGGDEDYSAHNWGGTVSVGFLFGR